MWLFDAAAFRAMLWDALKPWVFTLVVFGLGLLTGAVLWLS